MRSCVAMVPTGQCSVACRRRISASRAREIIGRPLAHGPLRKGPGRAKRDRPRPQKQQRDRGGTRRAAAHGVLTDGDELTVARSTWFCAIVVEGAAILAAPTGSEES